MLCDTTSLLGIRLIALSIENGIKSLKATNPHKRHAIHLGALLSNNLNATTARINHPAVKLIFKILRNIVLIFLPFF
jgi:hypothetical protein